MKRILARCILLVSYTQREMFYLPRVESVKVVHPNSLTFCSGWRGWISQLHLLIIIHFLLLGPCHQCVNLSVVYFASAGVKVHEFWGSAFQDTGHVLSTHLVSYVVSWLAQLRVSEDWHMFSLVVNRHSFWHSLDVCILMSSSSKGLTLDDNLVAGVSQGPIQLFK